MDEETKTRLIRGLSEALKEVKSLPEILDLKSDLPGGLSLAGRLGKIEGLIEGAIIIIKLA